MKVIRMIGYEIRNILKSKFLVVMMILLLVGSVAVPVIVKLTQGKPNNSGIIVGPKPYMEVRYAAGDSVVYGGGNGQPIKLGDITVNPDNPLYWNIQGLLQQKNDLTVNKGQYTKPETPNLISDYIDAQLSFYAKVAPYITDPSDYRVSLIYQCYNSLYDQFVYSHGDANTDALIEAMGNQKGMDPAAFRKQYIDITASQRQDSLSKAGKFLDQVTSLVQNDDFDLYITLSVQQQKDQIDSLQMQIDMQKKAIVDDPTKQESLGPVIDDLQRQIKLINDSTIPLLEYRRTKHIVPGKSIWQNTAIDDISNNRSNLAYTTIIKEDEFMKTQGMLAEYKSYQNYVNEQQKRIDQLNNNILIAQKSLDADKPDMKYVPAGPRSQSVVFLNYAALLSLFAVLLGGWIIASEFQQGTIRLLMIRPKTRTKILLSKFAAALIVSLALYSTCAVLNMLTNGICFGFSDFAFPNYTISGPVSFLAAFLPMFLACAVPILFGFAASFLLSTLTKNAAVSIAVPFVCFVGCIIALFLSLNRPSLGWIAWTPAPYAWMSLLYTFYSSVQGSFAFAPPFNTLFGVGLLVLLSAVCVAVSVVVFRKRDISN